METECTCIYSIYIISSIRTLLQDIMDTKSTDGICNHVLTGISGSGSRDKITKAHVANMVI